MKAAVLHGPNDLRIEDIPIPRIESDEVLIKVGATGICGSDLPRVLETGAHFYPMVLGHEFAGEIVEKGADVLNLAIGDRVAGAPLIPCHACLDCAQGYYAQCKNYKFIGSHVFGSWAEYVKAPARNAFKLPAGVNAEQGAFFEPVTVALHDLFVMDFRGGTDVAVVGVGTIGLLALACARLLGAKRIFAMDINEERLALARELGADVCLDTEGEGFKAAVNRETGGRGFPQVIEACGAEATIKLSLEIAGNRGDVMLIGTPAKNLTFSPREFEQLNRKELTERGSWMSYSAPFPGKEWELAGYYFAQGLLRVERLIDRVAPLEQIGGIFEEFRRPGAIKGKVLLTPA